MTNKQIIQTIEKKRKDMGLSYDTLSKSTGVTPETIRNTLKDRNSPKLSTLIDICNALGIEIIVKYKTN